MGSSPSKEGKHEQSDMEGYPQTASQVDTVNKNNNGGDLKVTEDSGQAHVTGKDDVCGARTTEKEAKTPGKVTSGGQHKCRSILVRDFHGEISKLERYFKRKYDRDIKAMKQVDWKRMIVEFKSRQVAEEVLKVSHHVEGETLTLNLQENTCSPKTIEEKFTEDQNKEQVMPAMSEIKGENDYHPDFRKAEKISPQKLSRPDVEHRKRLDWQETRPINDDKEESSNNAQNQDTTNKLAKAAGGDAHEKITSGTVHATDMELDAVKVEFIQKVHRKEFENIRTSNNIVIVVDTEPLSCRVIFRETSPGKGDVKRACDQFFGLYQSISDQLSRDNTIHVLTQLPNCTIQTLNKALLDAKADECVLVKNCLNDDFKIVFYGSKHDVKNAITAFLKTSLMQQNVDDVEERSMAHEQKSPNNRPVETSKDTHFEGTIGDITVCVHEGELTRQMVDVVVNAANNRLDHKGGVALAISNAGGRRIQEESRDYVMKHGSLYIGQAMHTGAGNMPCKYVIHTVGPMWDSHSDRETVKKQLREALTNVLQYASNTLQATSIAIPAISAGIYGVPVDVCAKQLMLATLTFAQSPSHNNTLRHIKFINIDGQVNRAFVRVFSGSIPPNYDMAKTFEHISSKDCPICMDKAIDPRKLNCCGNEFCSNCIKNAFWVKPICPTCGHQYGALKGDQPKGGTMEVRESSEFLPGYPECGSLQIHYHIPSGSQEHCHPNPGRLYAGADRHAYLPDNKEGREILQLLKKAFENRLVFTVGTSATTGRTDVVTWNDIHHKTSIEVMDTRTQTTSDE